MLPYARNNSSRWAWLGRLAMVSVVWIAAACQGAGPKKIGDATLAPVAAGFEEVPKEAEGAPLVVVLPNTTPTIPDAPVVKLAVDRKVPWGMVKAIVDRMESEGRTPILLVAKRNEVKMLRLKDPLYGKPIGVYAFLDGKLCVKHPGVLEKKCTQTYYKDYIDGAHTRELVREAVLGYKRQDVLVVLPLALTWGDAVTALAATRSCCGDREVRVALYEQDSEEAEQAEQDSEQAGQGSEEAAQDSEQAGQPAAQ